MRSVLLILFTLFSSSLVAQWTKADSLKVMDLSLKCFEQADLDPVKAIAIGREAVALAERIKFNGGIARSHAHLGYAYMRKSAFDSARIELDKAMHTYLSVGDSCDYASVLHTVGLNHQMQQQQDSALACFMRSLKLEKGCSHDHVRSTRLFAIGSSYEALLRFEDALGYYAEALSLDSARGDSSRLAQEHIAVANMNSALERYDVAIDHYEQSIAISKARGDGLMAGYIHYNLGELAHRRGDDASAVAHARASVDLFIQLDRKAELAHASILLGSLHIARGEGVVAEKHLLQAYHLADSLGLRDDRAQAMYNLALAKEVQNDARGAMEWMKRYVAYDDSLKRQDRDASMAEMTTRFETEKKEKELVESKAREAEATAAADRLRAQRTAYIGGALVLAAFLVLFISRYRMKRKAAEELGRVNAEVLRQKDRAEESERAKDRFLANVSHEIRTPLNAIMGFTGLLMHEHRDERTARYLGNIREAGDNLLVVINDVLDLSRIEAGRLRLVSESFDLRRTASLCEEMLRHRALEQGDELLLEIEPSVPRWVHGDSARLLQILLNLVGNALKFTNGGAVRLRIEHADDRCRIMVSDNGIGIPQEKLASIFDRFTQVAPSDQRRYSGMGLGLTIVKELVDLHQGSIKVESEVGKGTTFTVDLPLPVAAAPAHAPSKEPKHATNGSLAGHAILIAEDNEMNALVTTETLRRYYPDSEAIVVRTGTEAVRMVEEDEDDDIALVLMDVQMPELDGMAATRLIRQLSTARREVPIIALTASVLPSDLSRCIDAGMDACVSKPFQASELISAIGRLTGDHGARTGVGYDVTDPQVALYRWLVPPRLKALLLAIEEKRHDEVKRIVHTLRPQLVERDARFAALCDHVLQGTSDGSGPWSMDTHELAHAIEESLA
ncbi:MAG: response regulator [Flavobacteriales bacterium]|nr:response regulator [Flavobacteriales bacterium]